MKHRNLCLALMLPAFALATSSVASEIYKRVNEDGVVEYSDIPSDDADRVEVVPNVVETNPVQRRERPADPEQKDETPVVEANDESESDIVADNNPGRATRNAVRALSQPRPQPR